MKHFKFLVLAVAVFGLTACSSDDDNNNNSFELSNANLAGTYQIVFLEGQIQETEDVGGTDIVSRTRTLVGDTFSSTNYVFSESGTVSTSGSYRLTVTTTTISEPTPVVETEIVNIEEETLLYSIMTDTNILVIDGDSYTVTRFNSNEIYLEYEEVDVNGDVTQTRTEEVRLERQN